MFWIGKKSAIDTANDLASAVVVARPEYLDGEELPPESRVTKVWAIPMETATAGVWAIPVFGGIDTPKGVEAVETVEWPEDEAESDDE